MFHVGDYVKIKKVGRRYSTYASFFEKRCPELLDEYMINYDGMNGNNPKNNECGTILFVGRHTVNDKVLLMVIQIDNREGVFLFDALNGALELISHNTAFDVPAIEQHELLSLLSV